MVNNPKNILIVRLGAIGDVVHVLPVLRPLHKGFPGSKISWLVEDKACDILTDRPDIDEVIVLPRKRWQRDIFKINKIFKTLIEFISFCKRLRSESYDMVIDFHGNFKSGILDLITGSENRIGYGKDHCKEFNYLFTNVRVCPSTKKMHRIEKYLTIIKHLNIDSSYQRPEIPVSNKDREYVLKFINSSDSGTSPMIVVHPGTSKFGKYKQWPVLNYSALADMLIESFKAKVVFTWGPGELNAVNEIVMNMKHKGTVACETGPIKQLTEIIRCADLFISCDTGPMHIASILDIPIVAIFGPKDPVIYGPYNAKSVVVRKDLPCSPCKKRTCPGPECMTSILPADVFVAAGKLIERRI